MNTNILLTVLLVLILVLVVLSIIYSSIYYSYVSSIDSLINNETINNLINNETINNLINNETINNLIDNETINTLSENVNANNIDLPVTSGLVGYYTGDSYDGNIWYDMSGLKNNVTRISKNINKSTLNGVSYLTGNTNNLYIDFPIPLFSSGYTLFTLAKYNGNNKDRIFQASNYNWLSGFGGNKSGVAHHYDKWITSTTATSLGDGWIMSTDQRNLYRANGVDLSKNTTSKIGDINLVVGTNGMYIDTTKNADFAVALVMIYNRQLTSNEILNVEKWIKDTHKGWF